MKNKNCIKFIEGKGCPYCKFKCAYCEHGVMPVEDEKNDESYEGYCTMGMTGCLNCKLFKPKKDQKDKKFPEVKRKPHIWKSEEEYQEAKKKEMTRLKLKMSEIIREIAWWMPEDDWYETFKTTLTFLGKYYEY